MANVEISDTELAQLKADAERAKDLESKAKAAEDYQKDMFRFKAEAKELAEKLAKVNEGQEAADRAKLAEQGQYKTLLEKAEAEKVELKRQADGALESVSLFVRRRDVESEAVKAGIRPEALSDLRLLGLDKLEVQREGQEIKVKGSADFVAEQKKLRPHWFADAKAPQFDNGKGGSAAKTEGKDLATLYIKDRAAYNEAVKAMVAGKP